jgi:hypothetical protein
MEKLRGMADARDRDETGKPLSAEGAATLVSLLETRALVLHRAQVVDRLRELRDSAEFEALPDDLRDRIREVVSAAETVDVGTAAPLGEGPGDSPPSPLSSADAVPAARSSSVRSLGRSTSRLVRAARRLFRPE